MCRPEPPEYPGCTPAQVRPLYRARFAGEYTGHAEGYRYHRMGQHPRGVIFAHLPPALNAKLARLYARAVERYAAGHTESVVDSEGQTHVVVAYPKYRTWAGFRAHTTALCNGTTVTVHFPVQYCWAITKLGQAGAVVRSLLASTTRIAMSCDGFAIGGWSTGAFAAWKMGTGVLAGGYYGAVGVEIGCQTTNLWNWVSNLW